MVMVITPQLLWKDFDRKATPLNASIVKEKEDARISEKFIYFNGDAVSDGVPRIFARLITVKGSINADTPIILFLPSLKQNIEDIDFSLFLDSGYAILAVDYSGKISDERTHRTIYPKSLSYANFTEIEYTENVSDFNTYEAKFINTFPENPKDTCWYVWATISMRAITLIENEGFSKIGVIGYGTGGAQVWKIALCENSIVAGAVLFTSGLDMIDYSQQPGVDLISFKASIGTSSYAPLIKFPIFMLQHTNDPYGVFDRALETFSEITRTDCLFSIEAKTDRSLSEHQSKNLTTWFASHFTGEGVLPKPPQISVFASENKLYCQINPNKVSQLSFFTMENDPTFTKMPDFCLNKVVSAELYYSSGALKSVYRNWRKLDPELIGDEEYLKQLQVYSPNEMLYIFGNLVYDCGMTLSTPLVSKIPSSMNIAAAPFNKKRLIYDSDMGTGEWHSEPFPPVIKEGPMGISGISSFGTLITYKIGDVVYSGLRDYILSIIIYSSVNQNLDFLVTDGINYKTYGCTRQVCASDNWVKLNFSVSDFKSSDGVFTDWGRAARFKIEAKNNIILCSMLWV